MVLNFATVANAYDLNVKVSGQGPAIVFLHGLMGSHRYWENIISSIGPNHMSIAPDLLGFGKSPKPQTDYSVQDHLQSIEKTISKYISNGQQIYLVGHSMGATLALNYAIERPTSIRGIVLINPPVFSDENDLKEHLKKSSAPLLMSLLVNGWIGEVICKIHEMFPSILKVLAKPFTRSLPSEIGADMLKHTWKSYSGSMKNVLLNQNLLELIKKVDAPILIITSEDDMYTDIVQLKKLSRRGKISLEIMSGDHHMVIRNPQQVSLVIKNFIN